MNTSTLTCTEPKVYSGFEYREENFNPSREVRALIIYNDKKLKAGIGGDLNVNNCFIWKQSPLQNDGPADSVMASLEMLKDHAGYVTSTYRL